MMQPLRFDEEELARSLDQLPPKLMAVFAAACAQRLLPAYGRFAENSGRGDARVMISILERIWSDLDGAPMLEQELETHLETCMSLIPGEEDEPWTDEQAGAEDAGAAVAYTLRTLTAGKGKEAAWAARRSYEAVDHHLTHRIGIDPSAPGGEERLLAHPLVQAELARQRRDLDELRQAATTGDTAIVARIRSRAVSEARAMFEEQR